MKWRNSGWWMAATLLALMTVTGVGQSLYTGQTYNSAAGVSSGPVSGSDQQVQAGDLVGKQGQKKVDLFTGSFGYAIPINCAPARNGSEPALSLAYSSAEGNDWCGMGWKLEIGSIERYTRDGFPIAYSTATPPAPLTQYDDTKGFMLNLSGKGSRLFAVATNAPLVEYRAEIDTEFLRCFLNTNNNSWTVYDKSGNAYYFGETTGSRVANPKTGWSGYGGTFQWALDQIVTATGDWTTLAYTNYTSPYTGLPERTLYPLQIAYNGHTNCNGYSANFPGTNTITFQTAIRSSDWHFSYRWGFRTEQDRLLTNILCQVGGQNLWSYSLNYGTSLATARYLLTNVVVYGYASGGSTATAYLTNSFGYQANANAVSFGPVIQWGNLSLPAPGQPGYYNPDVTQLSDNVSDYNYTIADLIDVDGDGLPDRIAYDPATQPNQYIEQKNLGMQSSGNGLFGTTNAFGPSSTATSGMTQSQAYTASPSNPIPDADDDVASWAAMNSTYVRLRDIDGDGLPDKVAGYWAAVNSFGSSPYIAYTNFAVMLNTGQGFTNESNWAVSTGPLSLSNPSSSAYFCVESGGPIVGFFDINGDGRPDRVMATFTNSPATNFLVQFNTGTNFTQPVSFGPYHSQNWNENAGESSSPENWAGIETPEAHMIDLNGDGLPDRVMYPLNSSGAEVTHPASYYAVEYNDGYSFESTNNSTSMPGAFDQWLGIANQSSSATSYGGVTFYPDAILDLPFGGMFDVNGDGLPDRVVVDGASLSTTNTIWYVYLNNGHGFNATPIVVTNIANQGQSSSTAEYPYWSMQGADPNGNLLTTLIDINGDGLLDRVMSVYSGATGSTTTSNYFLVQLNQGPYPDLLTNVNNGIGGTISVTYNSSTAYDNRVYTTNANSVSHMPFPRQVAATVTESDGINPLQTTAYSYAGGYYDGVRREFHGFGVVTNIDPTLRMTVTYFHTGGGRNYSALGEFQDTNPTNGTGDFAKSGMAYRVETYGNDGELYHVTVNQVSQDSLGNARYFPFVATNFDCDYPGNGTPLVTATQFAYDQTTGNLTNKIAWGQVTGFSPTNVGSFSFTDADPTDNRYYNTTYATVSSNSYIVDLPATVILADGNNNTVRETDYAYNPWSGTIASKLIRIAAGYYATNSYGSYTAYGLAGQTTDPVGVSTTITYDSAYNTFPATTTVGSFNTSTVYDPRSGALASSTDPAGLTITNSFDLFCRPIETDKIPIGGGSAVWMKRYAYPAVLNRVSAGLATNYADVIVNDGVGGFTNRTYIDGFGRPVQTRIQGENGNFRVVSTAYDGRGNAFLTTWPVFGAAIGFTFPTNGTTATWIGYDAPGRVATNRPVSVTFNANGSVIATTVSGGDTGSPLGAKTWSYVNGTNPWWIIYTDEDGQTNRYGLDAFGRTNQILQVDGASIYTNLLKYNQADDLTNLVNADGENIYWAYNDAGDVVALADPYLGQWTYQRDYAGRLRVQTDARGDVVSNSYVTATGQDALGRLQVQTVFSTNYSAHTLVPAYTNTFFYDSGTNGYTVYPGTLSRVTDSQGYEQIGYDVRARTIKTTRYLNINTNSYTTTNGYDDGDNIVAIGYPNAGPVVNYAYFHGKSINQISLAGGSYNYYTAGAASFDEYEHVTGFGYGSGLTNARSYFPVSKRLQTASAGSSGSVFSRTYGYTAGNDITNLSGTGLTNAVTVTYYNLHRIKSYSGISGGTNYGYDPAGNITTNSEGGGSRYTYANPRIQAVRTAFGYTNLYDLCGNMVVRHGGLTNAQALTYDPENRLSMIAQAGVFGDQFGYAYDGARLWKHLNQNPTNVQVWIGNIYEEKGGKKLFHVFAGGEQVCTFETNSALYGGSSTNAVGYYYHQDNLNTSSALSSSSGTQIEVDVYYPFGRTQTTTPQAGFQVSRRFTGQVFDAESGLYYYNARYYDPELGRFIQPDSVIPDIANPQSYNRYAYVLNDPLRYNDPTGHEGDDDLDNIPLTLGGGHALLRQESGGASASLYNKSGGELNTVATVGRAAAEMNPVVGAVDGGIGLVTGKDAVNGGKLSNGQRVLAGVNGAISIIPGEGAELKAGEKILDDSAKITDKLSSEGVTRVTGDALAAARKEFNAVKPKAWMDEAAKNPEKYTTEQLARMKKGQAPIGSDGFPMEIHHKTPLAEGGANTQDNFEFLTRTDHRLGDNYKANHPNLP